METFRIRAKARLGEQKESEIFKSTTEESYCHVVRRVMKGNTVSDALRSKQVRNAERTYEVAEGETTCPRCGSRRIIKNELQTRSADESKTVFCECSVCKKSFKF